MNDEQELKKIKDLTYELADAVSKLAIANRYTGLWDHVRFEECKKPFNEINHKRVYISEKNSRFNVEERAVQRRRLDLILTEIVSISNKK